MAAPRIFISSTCYDLTEIRYQLRTFIESMGYEPVMSEFGDIFYDLGGHVQDSCADEIGRTNMFLLIVGNNYGSLYHKESVGNKLPDSVTLTEFRKALRIGVPKYIFLNKYVQHDYDNYQRLLRKHFADYFSKNEVENEDIDSIKKKLKSEYDENYQFPHSTYQYIFYFLDILHSLDTNNAIYSFESFDDISNTLKKQWAGLMYESLTKERTVPIEIVEQLSTKMDKIERQVRLIVEGVSPSKSNKKVMLDLSKVVSGLDLDDLEKTQEKIHSNLSQLFWYQSSKRLVFREEYTEELMEEWLSNLNKRIEEFKWSKFISITDIFNEVKYTYWKGRTDVPFKVLLELKGILEVLPDKEKLTFRKMLVNEFNKFFEQEPEPATEDDSLQF